MMCKVPWWAVQGKDRLPASRILLYEKEINISLVYAMIILHFLLHVANYISNQRISFATVRPWIRHMPSPGNVSVYTAAVAGVRNPNDHWRQVLFPGQELCPLLLVTAPQFVPGSVLAPTISPGGQVRLNHFLVPVVNMWPQFACVHAKSLPSNPTLEPHGL